MHNSPLPTIGVIIPTFKAEKHLRFCLPPLVNSQLKPRVLVIDSSSNDNTIAVAREMGAETLTISQKEFNHGKTREMARKYLNTDIVVFLTQDAYANDFTLDYLVRPITGERASVAYARQIPHDGAGYFETFHRHFNYATESHVRSINDLDKYGVYTYFCSNSCAAYSNKALDEIGGFKHVLFGEDTIAVAELLKKGHSIAYEAEATVKHSHSYSLMEEFRRHFDIGLSRRQHSHLMRLGGSDEKRGAAYVKAMIKDIMKERPWLLPYALAQISVKLAAYRIGGLSLNAPIGWKKALSSQKAFWK